MALVDSALEGALKGIFTQMEDAAWDSPKSGDWFAGELAKVMDTQIKTAEVNTGITVIGGTVSGGALTGAQTAAKGTIS